VRMLLEDVRYGCRMIRRQPGYSFIVALTLALAIGANTVIFSFANILLLRPLPLRDPDGMAWVWWTNAQRGLDRSNVSAPELFDLRAALTTCESVAAHARGTYTLTGRGDATRLEAFRTTSNLFDTWGVRPAIGRGFLDGEDRPGARAVAVVSHQFWERALSATPGIIGQDLVLDGVHHTIVGVLGPEIEIGNLSTIDVWTPLTLDPSSPRDERTLRVSARRKPGVSLEQVDAQARAVAKRLEADYPATNAGWSARTVSTKVAMTGNDTWLVLGLLGVVVGLVLLIACANLANLVLVRATGRRKELAIRSALGAARGRIVRQLVTESMLLGIIGGGLGLGVAFAALRLIRSVAAEPFFQLVTVDLNVLLFAVVLSLAAPLIFSLLPALDSARGDVSETLKDTARAGGSARAGRSRSALVVSQLTLAMTLLIFAGLLVRTMIAITRAPLGFDATHLLTFQIELPRWKYTSDADAVRFWQMLELRLHGVPGAQRVAASTRLPVLDAGRTTTIDIQGREFAGDANRPWARSATVTSGYFATAGIPVIAGRPFTNHDTTDSPLVALVNREMARRLWQQPERALGARVRVSTGDSGGPWLEIVGVVGDVKRADRVGSDPELFLAVLQHTPRGLWYIVRANMAASLTPSVRAAVRELDADIAVRDLRTFEDALEIDQSSSRILIGLFVAFAGLALALAASGLYGMMAYSVSQRVQEFGIRMALGALPTDIRRLVASQSFALVGVGLLLGLGGGAALGRVATSLLYEVSPFDVVTFTAVAMVLGIVAFIACAAPVRRATRIDAVSALRSE
jgi:putative ABC transport system permease protein